MVPQIFVKQKNRKAYVTLISVIILGAISILVLTTTIAVDTESIFATDVMDQGKQARFFADACAEKAIDLLKQNNVYAGTESYTFTSGSCTVGAVSGTGNTNRTFTTTGVFENATRKVAVTVTTINPTTAIGSWQEVQ